MHGGDFKASLLLLCVLCLDTPREGEYGQYYFLYLHIHTEVCLLLSVNETNGQKKMGKGGTLPNLMPYGIGAVPPFLLNPLISFERQREEKERDKRVRTATRQTEM